MQVEAMKNIIVIITHSVTAKEKLLRVKQLEFSGQLYPVSVYRAADRDTCRGVIHQIPANTPSDTLLRNLSAPGYQILAARMMGQTTSALITFQGTYVPTTVRYEYAQIRCYTHRPKVQQCYKCLALGHRQDVCTQPTEKCPECGFQNKSEAHDCITKCSNCSGPHSALDELCPARIESSKITRKQEYAKRLATRKSQQAQAERQSPPNSRHVNSTPNPSKRQNGLSYAQVIRPAAFTKLHNPFEPLTTIKEKTPPPDTAEHFPHLPPPAKKPRTPSLPPGEPNTLQVPSPMQPQAENVTPSQAPPIYESAAYSQHITPMDTQNPEHLSQKRTREEPTLDNSSKLDPIQQAIVSIQSAIETLAASVQDIKRENCNLQQKQTQLETILSSIQKQDEINAQFSQRINNLESKMDSILGILQQQHGCTTT